jgi:hypothetical protein
MEYDSPIFIATVKKILRDGVAHLAADLQDLKDAVQANRQADEKRYQTKPVSITDLRTEIPIQVQTEPKRSKKENIWRYVIGTLEAFAFIAIIAYTFVAHNQWEAMSRANELSMSNYRRIRIDANEQLKETAKQTKLAGETLSETANNFRVEQRAWVGLYAVIVRTKLPDAPPNSIPFQMVWSNTGHTPALDAKTDGGFLYRKVNYVLESSFSTEHTTLMNPGEKTTIAVYPPNQSGVGPPLYASIPPAGEFLFIRGTVTYTDIFGKPHRTEFCQRVDETKVDQANSIFNLVFCNAHNHEN